MSEAKVKIEKKLCHLCSKPVYVAEEKLLESFTFHPNCAQNWLKQKEVDRQKSQHQTILEVIAREEFAKANLKHVETVDKAQPQVEAVPVRKNVHSKVMEQIQHVEANELKHVETVDKAQPSIDCKAKIKKSNRPKLMNEVKGFKGFEERKAEYEKQAQARNEVKEKVIEGVKTEKVALTHVETVDKSQPVIESVPVRKNVHSKVMEQIQHVEANELKHVDTVDKAQPVIAKDAHVKASSRPKLMAEVRGLSEKLLSYQQNVEESQKSLEPCFNKEGGDIHELSGITKRAKSAYEGVVVQDTNVVVSKSNNDLDTVSEGVAQKVKEQYQKEVEEKK